MKVTELQKKDQKELHELLQEKRTALGELRFKLALDEEKQVRKARVLRKDIARILTVLNQAKEGIVQTNN